MSTTTQIKTPVKVGETRFTHTFNGYILWDDSGNPLGVIRQKSDAIAVARAMNAVPKLVEALEIARQEFEHIQQAAGQAASGKQYDSSWIRGRDLPMLERFDRANDARLFAGRGIEDTTKALAAATKEPVGTAARLRATIADLERERDAAVQWAREAEDDRDENKGEAAHWYCESHETLQAMVKYKDDADRMRPVVDAAVKRRLAFVEYVDNQDEDKDVRLLAASRDADMKFDAAVSAYLSAQAEQAKTPLVAVQEQDGHRTVMLSRELIEAGQRASPLIRPSGCKHEKVMPKIEIPDDELFKLSESEVRSRYPRFQGVCPDCGERVICYASSSHYIAGDW